MIASHLVALALAALAPLGAARGPSLPDPSAQEVDEDRSAAVRDVLAGSALNGVEELAAELAALGLGALPALLAALEAGSSPAATVPPLGPSQRLAVLRAFRLFPRGEVLLFLRRSALEADVATRARALEVLGEIATPKNVDLFLALVDVAEEEWSDDRLGAALTAGLERLLVAHPQACWPIAARLLEFPPVLYLPVVKSIVAAGAREELPSLLAELLGKDSRLDPWLMVELRHACRARRECVEPRVLADVRCLLDSKDPETVKETVLTLGELEDVESFHALVALLETSGDDLATMACQALQRISGARLGRDPKAWEALWADELEWRRRHSGRWLRWLREDDPAKNAEALQALSGRLLFRNEIAEALRPCLARREAELVRLACAVLGQLRAYSGVPDLIACLEHRDAGVRESARLALVRLLGRIPSPDAPE